VFAAQPGDPNSSRPPQNGVQLYDRALADLYWKMFLEHVYSDQKQKDITQRREAERLERELIRKAARFVELWRAFTEELNNRGTFNIKTARELSKSFRELEKSGYWPREQSR
jgi:hypothetical protein